MRAVLEHFEGTSLFVSHNRDEVYRLCDSIAVMNSGRVETHGEKWSLFERPQIFSAALLTGCKNISAIEKQGTDLILATDWGITVKTALKPDAEIEYIGIRAHSFELAQSLEEPNAFECEILQVIEDTFSMILIVKNKNTPASQQAQGIYWETSKEQWKGIRGKPLLLKIPQEKILLLTK
jgi:molybdate transport system ATP-binding protein